MRIEYIADDGKRFDNEIDCLNHEWILNHPYLEDIKIYNKDGAEFVNIMAEDTYLNCYKIIVPDNNCLNDLHEFADYSGFGAYLNITEPGIWEEDEHSSSIFIKTGDIINRGYK